MRAADERELERKSSFNESMIKVIFRVIAYMKPYWFLAILGVSLLFVNVFFNIKVALIIKELTDAIGQKDLSKIFSLLKFYVPYSVFFILLMCIGNFIRGYVQNLVSRDLCSELYNRINKLPYRQVQGTHTGDLVERVNKDVDQAVGLIGGTVYSLLENVFICIGSFLYLTSISLPLALLVLITGPITFVVGRVFDSRIRKVGLDIQDKGGEVRGVLQEFLQGMAVVRAFNMEEDFHNRFMNSRESQIHIMKKRTLLTVIMWRIVITTNITASLLIIYFVAIATINGKLAIGSMLAFAFLMGRVQWPFVNISKNWGSVQQSYGAAQRVFEILGVTSEGVTSKQIKSEVQNEDIALDFSQVSFTYKSSEDKKDDKLLFNNLSLQVGKGEVVALVGPSGSGKTTVARLCLGLYIPDRGDITVFNKSIVNELNEARQMIAYVPQTPYLFAGTIRENISYGSEGVSNEEIVEAAKAANAHEFIEKLEKGYDSLIGERGVTLSGGQRQRLAIARAFVRKSPVIVLDEATSALDNESEYLVQQSMDRLMKDRSVLVIAHRLSTIRSADRIVVMNEGSIAEEGTHDQLMELKGLYSELYKLSVEVKTP